ncbi:hypothetical protein STEG23_013194, partial [Scotinomys teguina]
MQRGLQIPDKLCVEIIPNPICKPTRLVINPGTQFYTTHTFRWNIHFFAELLLTVGIYSILDQRQQLEDSSSYALS